MLKMPFWGAPRATSRLAVPAFSALCALVFVGSLAVAPTASAATPLTVGKTTSGTLSTSDTRLDNGEYYDDFELRLRAGQVVRIELASTNFDAYLFARGDGVHLDDDDSGPAPLGSSLEFSVTSDTVVRVVVTSASAGETGAYRLTVRSLGSVQAQVPQQPPMPDARRSSSSATPSHSQTQAAGAGEMPDYPRDTSAPTGRTPLAFGRAVNGTLSAGDRRLNDGEYVDGFDLRVGAGQVVRLELSSRAFDAYLYVSGEGVRLDDDDSGPAPRGAALEFTSPDDMVIGVYVTSSRPGETGAYQLVARSLGHVRVEMPQRFEQPPAR